MTGMLADVAWALASVLAFTAAICAWLAACQWLDSLEDADGEREKWERVGRGGSVGFR